MITKEKVFFLNQLIDSMEDAAKKLEEESSSRKKEELIDFILSIQSEIKNMILIEK